MKKSMCMVICLIIMLSVGSTAWSKEMRPKEFEKKVVMFKDRVMDGKPFDCLAAKKELIEDLYRTSYAQDFSTKFDTIVRRSRGLSFSIESALASSKTTEEFKAVKDRYEEWNDFCRLADRAPEDFRKGVIQEYLMDKKREGQPPFPIESAKWEADETSTPDVEAFKKELPNAEVVVSKAIDALKKKNEDNFAKLFPEKLQLLRKAEPETSEINALFKREREDNWKEGMTTEVAPVFVRADLEMAAKRYKKDRVIKAVLRRYDGEKTKLSAVGLEKVGNDYVIRYWKTGSFDMMNRRR